MIDINFQPIFDYIDQKEASILDQVREIIRDEVGDMRTILGNQVAQMQNHDEQMVIMGFRTNRLEEWAAPLGKKLRMPLEL